MKKIFTGICFLVLCAMLFSCKEIQPVTIGGVSNIKLINLSKEGLEFDFDMKIDNPNSVGVSVWPSTFKASVGDIDVGYVKLNKRTKIKANGSHTSTFHIKSDFSKLGFADITKVIPMVSSRSGTLGLDGNMRVGKWFYRKKFPVTLRKTVSLNK
jgi:LEA14-like dessication related protein